MKKEEFVKKMGEMVQAFDKEWQHPYDPDDMNMADWFEQFDAFVETCDLDEDETA